MQKKRGAPKGNQNAKTHGFYAQSYTHAERRELSQTKLEYRANNIKFFKVRIARIAERIKPSASPPMSFHENLLALRTVVIALSRIYASYNHKHQVQNGVEKDPEKEMVEFYRALGMTEAEIEQEMYGVTPPRISRGKRGGQSGNLNALKHGFYSSHYTPAALRRLDDMKEDEVTEEIGLLQILMKRVFIGMQADIPLVEYLKADQTLSYADTCLEKLYRIRGVGFNVDALITEAITAVQKDLGITD